MTHTQMFVTYSDIMKKVVFMTYTAAHHQEAFEILWLDFLGGSHVIHLYAFCKTTRLYLQCSFLSLSFHVS